MSKIAFIGLGAMGSRMARHLVAAGRQVTVYNRSPGPAAELEAAGAARAASPRDAASDAEFVITMLTDDDAARQVWLDPGAGIAASARPGTVLIESSTVTPSWIDELRTALADRGTDLLDAPVAGSLPQAEQKQLVYLVGGRTAALDRARPVLGEMGAKIHHVGPSGRGALVKLAVNALLAAQVELTAELFGLLAASGMDLEHASKLLGDLPVTSPAARAYAAMIASGDTTTMFPIDLVVKDLRYSVDAADAVGSPTPVVAAVREVFERARAEGHGDDNITGVASLFV